jgi:tripartite ATP-independent transporter DctM subunit
VTAAILLLGFLGFLGLLALGLPVAIALAGAGIIFALVDGSVPLLAIVHRMVGGVDSFPLLCVPFFVMAGMLMNTGGITERLFGFVSLAVRPLKGGLGHANVLASTLFAGMSGSATADAVGLGQVEMRAMLAAGYEREFSAGITAASSLIGPIIPPSIALVAYGVSAEVSIGALFMAGIVPGLLLTLVLMAYVAVLAQLRNFPSGPLAPLRELLPSLRRALLPLMMPVILIGGIVGGVGTR